MTDEPARFRVIDGGGEQPASRKPIRKTKPSGKRETRKLHVCRCGQSGLIRARLGAFEVDGKLSGGEDWHVCIGCHEPQYRIKGYD